MKILTNIENITDAELLTLQEEARLRDIQVLEKKLKKLKDI